MGEGDRTPKTLADVSHLFFSAVQERARTGDEPAPAGRRDSGSVAPASADGTPARGEGPWRRTRMFVITGGNDAPGKSTVAVNFAQAFAARGRVGLFDAGGGVPNARFYIGLPSRNYLSGVLGDERPAATAVLSESGVIVVDCDACRATAADMFSGDNVVAVDIPGRGREELDFAVVDLPIDRWGWIEPVLERVGLFVVVARPGRRSFEQTFATLAVLRRRCGVESAALLVNMVPDYRYAIEFHAKTRTAAKRLLNMETHFMGGVVFEREIGHVQRERGAIIRSRSDSVSALSVREAAWNAVGFEKGEESRTVLPVRQK